MATPNYGYEKRQRELAKKKKKEEKLRAKVTGSRPDDDSPGGQDNGQGDAPAPSVPDAGSSQPG